jgi:hypothetical protein
MRTLITLSCLIALGGCAIVIAPNGDGDDVHVRSVFGSDAITGDGHVISESRALAAVAGVETSGSVQVEVRVGPAASLQVSADSNLLPLVRTEVVGNTLRVWTTGSFRTSNPMRVVVTTPQLAQVQASGSGRLMVSGLNGGPLKVSKSGSGRTELVGRVGTLDVSSSGSGGIDASGLQTGNLNVSISGSGRVNIGTVQADSMTLNMNSSGGFQANGAVQMLNARVNGSGSAHLTGLASQRADLIVSGSGGISASVKQTLVAQSNGSGGITVYGSPSQSNTTGKHVQIIN